MGTHQAPDTGELWWQSLRSYHPSSCLDLESTAKHHLPKPPMPSYKDILLVYFPPCRVTDEGGNDNPFQYSCLENPMDRRAWQAMVHGVAKNWTQLTKQQSHRGRKHSLGGQERSHIFPRLDKLCLFFPLDKVLHVAVPRKGLCPEIQAPNLDWAQLSTISFHGARYSTSRCLCHGAAYTHIVHVFRWARPELLPGRHISLTLCPCGPEQKPAQSRPPQNTGRMKEHWGLPWRLRGKEPACQCRRRGFNPWAERIPCTLKQRSPCTTTIEQGSRDCWTHVLQLRKPACPGAHAPQQEKPLPWEARAPPRSQREKSPSDSEDAAQSKLK